MFLKDQTLTFPEGLLFAVEGPDVNFREYLSCLMDLPVAGPDGIPLVVEGKPKAQKYF